MAYYYQIVVYKDGERAYEIEDISSTLNALGAKLHDMVEETVAALAQETD